MGSHSRNCSWRTRPCGSPRVSCSNLQIAFSTSKQFSNIRIACTCVLAIATKSCGDRDSKLFSKDRSGSTVRIARSIWPRPVSRQLRKVVERIANARAYSVIASVLAAKGHRTAAKLKRLLPSARWLQFQRQLHRTANQKLPRHDQQKQQRCCHAQ